MKSMAPCGDVVGNAPDCSSLHGNRLLSSICVGPPGNAEGSSGESEGEIWCHGPWAALATDLSLGLVLLTCAFKPSSNKS